MSISTQLWSKYELAEKIANDIPEGAYLNLGIGLPTLVADYFGTKKEVILHTENGMLGMGPTPGPGEEDPDLINAGKQPVTILPGGSFFHHADSFAMMRGGHLDYCVLGAFQVSVHGDIANWSTGQKDAIPAVGGAMDLAIGAKNVYAMINLLTKQGQSKLVETCSYPLTGVRCVKRVYSDHAIFELGEAGAKVIDLAPGITFDTLQLLCGGILIK